MAEGIELQEIQIQNGQEIQNGQQLQIQNGQQLQIQNGQQLQIQNGGRGRDVPRRMENVVVQFQLRRIDAARVREDQARGQQGWPDRGRRLPEVKRYFRFLKYLSCGFFMLVAIFILKVSNVHFLLRVFNNDIIDREISIGLLIVFVIIIILCGFRYVLYGLENPAMRMTHIELGAGRRNPDGANVLPREEARHRNAPRPNNLPRELRRNPARRNILPRRQARRLRAFRDRPAA